MSRGVDEWMVEWIKVVDDDGRVCFAFSLACGINYAKDGYTLRFTVNVNAIIT